MLTPDQATSEITRLIEQAIVTQPRSLQRTIGPSEIGNPCDHCLAARLAGWEKHEVETPWVTVIGTSVHAWLETAFNRLDPNHTRFLTEARVKVGQIGHTDIWGSTDLLDMQTGMTVDWKIVGDNSLRIYRTGPSPVYRTQAHLYAKGWNDTGTPVNTVSIYFLPRNRQMRHGYWWHEPYQPDLAAAALARANHIQRQLDALTTVSIATRDKWITTLPRADGCWDCRRYPDKPAHKDPLNITTEREVKNHD